jgi:hypothetical protein
VKETEINIQKTKRSLLESDGCYWSTAATSIITPGALYTLGLASGQTHRDAIPFAASSTTAHNTAVGINTERDNGFSYGCRTGLFFCLPSSALMLFVDIMSVWVTVTDHLLVVSGSAWVTVTDHLLVVSGSSWVTVTEHLLVVSGSAWVTVIEHMLVVSGSAWVTVTDHLLVVSGSAWVTVIDHLLVVSGSAWVTVTDHLMVVSSIVWVYHTNYAK